MTWFFTEHHSVRADKDGCGSVGLWQQLALILPCRADVGIWPCIGPYGSTYSLGEENKWFVFLLRSLSLRTYKTGF